MKVKDLSQDLIGKRCKGIFLGFPVVGTIVALVEDTDPVYGEVCGKGVKIELDEPIYDGSGTYTYCESTARVFDDFGNLQYTELI